MLLEPLGLDFFSVFAALYRGAACGVVHHEPRSLRKCAPRSRSRDTGARSNDPVCDLGGLLFELVVRCRDRKGELELRVPALEAALSVEELRHAGQRPYVRFDLVGVLRLRLDVESLAAQVLADPAAGRLRHAVERLLEAGRDGVDREIGSTRLNSSHGSISYAVFCLKKK